MKVGTIVSIESRLRKFRSPLLCWRRLLDKLSGPYLSNDKVSLCRDSPQDGLSLSISDRYHGAIVVAL